MLRVDHVDDDGSLENSVVERHPLLEAVLATSNSADNVAGPENALDLHRANEVVLVFDVYDWDSDVFLLD